MKLLLNRFNDDGIETQGNLTAINDDGTTAYACVSLELAWKNNQHQISCIPTGTYNWAKVPATAHINYPHIQILNVPDRDGIMIHRGNLYHDSLGCVLVARSFNDINGDGEIDITNSRITMNALMAALPDSGTIEITNTKSL